MERLYMPYSHIIILCFDLLMAIVLKIRRRFGHFRIQLLVMCCVMLRARVHTLASIHFVFIHSTNTELSAFICFKILFTNVYSKNSKQ